MGYKGVFDANAYGQAGSMHGQKHYKAYVFRVWLRTWGVRLFLAGLLLTAYLSGR